MEPDWSEVAACTSHRPFPPPDRAWLMTMSWCDLCFLHWEVDPAELARHVPSSLPLDLFHGRAYLGVVPFRMEHVSGRLLPDLPGVSAFAELNVRTYVQREGMPGVYFFSLDATQPLAIWGARTFFHLRYLRAEMSVIREGDMVRYRSRRIDPRGPPGELVARYGPAGPVTAAERGSLEHFLTERYCLYTEGSRGEALRGHIQHAPWPLQPGSCEIEVDTVVPVPVTRRGPPLVHFARRIDVVGWPLERVSGG